MYQIWFAVFCLRSWRYWMSCESCVFPLIKHFLLLNAHNCAKINAHCVVMLLVRLSSLRTAHQTFLSPGWCQFNPVYPILNALVPLRLWAVLNWHITLFNFLVHRCKKGDAHIRLTGLDSTDNIVYPILRYQRVFFFLPSSFFLFSFNCFLI